MEISDAAINLAVGLAGAVIGGLFTLYATSKAFKLQNEKENRQEEKEAQNLLDALGVEIGTLWEFHMQRVGALVEQLSPGQPLEFYYPLTQDYFTVYDANAARIGQVKDAELRKSIVTCYNKCKKVVDGFKYNNELFRAWREAAIREGGIQSVDVQNHYKDLCGYAAVIREDHEELKIYIQQLHRLLNQR